MLVYSEIKLQLFLFPVPQFSWQAKEFGHKHFHAPGLTQYLFLTPKMTYAEIQLWNIPRSGAWESEREREREREGERLSEGDRQRRKDNDQARFLNVHMIVYVSCDMRTHRRLASLHLQLDMYVNVCMYAYMHT